MKTLVTTWLRAWWTDPEAAKRWLRAALASVGLMIVTVVPISGASSFADLAAALEILKSWSLSDWVVRLAAGFFFSSVHVPRPAVAAPAKPSVPPAVLVLLLGGLLFATVARADEPPAPTRQFGGCNKVGSFCYGPTMSLSLVGMDLGSGTFTTGIIPGAGYGATLWADKPYQVGIGGYVALQSGPATTSGMFSFIVSFAEYVRVGIARQIIGGDHRNLVVLGLGADLK